MTESLSAAEDMSDLSHFPKRPGLPRKCLEGIGIAVCSVIGMFMRPFQSRSLRISKETTYITEPLKSDGKQVDYFMAIRQATCPENVATDDNGYRLIVRHLGRDSDTEPAYYARVCEQLGLDADAIQSDMTYVDPCTFLRAYVQGSECDQALLDTLPPEDRSKGKLEDILESKLYRAWTFDDLPMMARWLEDSNSALDLIAQAACKLTFHVPLVRENEQEGVAVSLCEHVSMQTRSLARGLAARARYRIASGDIDGAIDDMIASKRLGRHAGHGPGIVDLIIGMGIEGIADHVGIAGSLAHRPTKEQLERLVNELGNLPSETEVNDKVAVERFCSLDVIQSYAHGTLRWKDDRFAAHSPLPYLAAIGVDWSTVAKRFSEVFEEMLAMGGRAPDTSLTVSRVLSFASTGARSRYVADALHGLLDPCWNATRTLAQRSACLKQMQRITLAMLLYECDHGTLPPAWSVDSAGNPLHSWRVLLLPYLGRQELYGRIRLDQPWDSEYNRQFHGEAMSIYRCPSDPAARSGQTSYSVVVGPDMPFEAGRGKRLSDFGPYSDDMILLVERAEPVGWMAPTREVQQTAAEEGIHGDEESGAPVVNGIRSRHTGYANCGLRNGVAHPVWEEIDRKLLGRLLRGTNAEKNADW